MPRQTETLSQTFSWIKRLNQWKGLTGAEKRWTRRELKAKARAWARQQCPA